MKTLAGLLVVTVFITHSAGYLIKVPTTSTATPMVWSGHTHWMLQKMMLPLFENVCETSSNPTISRLAQEFTFDSTEYLELEVIENLQNLISTGLLPKGNIFSEYNADHMKELKIVYDVLHNAKDFDVFYKAAAWSRQNLNCALYVNAIYMAIQGRRDTERLSIPAPYELLPNYFVDKDVIIQASSILAGEEITPSDAIREEGNAYHIDANYTALFYNNDDDSKLAYFREDIGLNSYYFLRKLRSAPWFNDDVNGNFGENLYQMMKQFMARYNLERYANGFSELDGINWDSVMDIPYDPKLIYSDGNAFAHRTLPLELSGNGDLALLQTIEDNVVTVVSHMHQSGYNKSQILNHLMEILVTSDRSYETLARQLLGKDLTNNGYSSAIDHDLTSLRDPMFWKINKKIVDIIDEALRILPTYTRNELYFPGVELVNIDVKKMMTACDYFEFDVTDALKMEESGSTFRIKVGQPRLNHKEFIIRLNVSSLVFEKGVVKIYLGPKLMPGELATKKNLFTLLDVFEVNLKVGSNIITRSSNSMKQFSEDFMSLNTIRKKVEDAQFGLDSLPLTTIQSQIEYPSRLILPKGTPQGLPLQMFVFIAPYMKASLSDTYTRNSMEFNSAILSPGYPLDLMIEDRQLFALPNAMIKYVTVTQKSDSNVENYGGPGIAKSWYTTDLHVSPSRPNYNTNYKVNDYTIKVNELNVDVNDVAADEYFTDEFYVIGLDDKPNLLKQSNSEPKSKAPFDYKAKKAQYDKKDYSTQKKYPKYDTKTKVDDEVSLPVIPSTDRIMDVYFDKKIEDSEINIVKDIKLVDDDMTQTDLYKEEVLPMPAMLKKDIGEDDKFDYKTKKRDRDYKIKMKKNYLDKLIKYAKKKNSTKIHAFEVTDKLVPQIKPYVTEPEMGKVMLTKDDTLLGNIANSGSSKLTDSIAEVYADTDKDKDYIEVSTNSPKDTPKSKLVWKKTDILKDMKVIKDSTTKPMYKTTVMPDVKTADLQEILDKKHFKGDKMEMDIKTKDDSLERQEDATTMKIDDSLDTEQLYKDIFRLDVDTDKYKVATDSRSFDPQENLAKFILSKGSIEFNNHITKDDLNIEKRAEISHTDVIQRDSEEKEPVILIEVVEERAPEMYDYIMRSVDTDTPKLPKQ